MKYKLLFVVTSLVFFSSYILLKEWKIDKNVSIKFYGDKADGMFTDLKGTILFDPSEISAAKFNVTIDVASIDMGPKMKSAHARSWFEVDQFPVIKFSSTAVTKSNDSFLLKGILEIHGVKKEIQIPFTFVQKSTGADFKGTLEVNRKDFGVDGSGGGSVGTAIKVDIIVPVI